MNPKTKNKILAGLLLAAFAIGALLPIVAFAQTTPGDPLSINRTTKRLNETLVKVPSASALVIESGGQLTLSGVTDKIVKTNGSGILQAATPGSDYLAAQGGIVPGFSLGGSAYDSAFNLNFADGVFFLGDVTGALNGTLLTVDDANEEITLGGNGIYLNARSTTVRHLYAQSATSAPTIAAGTGAGTSPTVAVAGAPMGGLVTITTGSSPATSATIATVTFVDDFTGAPRVVILTPANAAAAALNGAGEPFVDSANTTTAHFLITSGSSALAGATTYKFYYFVLQ